MRNKLGELFVAPQDVVLDNRTVVQPDSFFIAAARLHIVTDKNIQGAPDLVIEVESDSDERGDWLKKLHAFDRYGVKEVWHVRPEPRTVDIFRRTRAGLNQVERVGPNGKFRSPLLPRLSIAAATIWV